MKPFNPEMEVDGGTQTNGDRAERAQRALDAYWGDDGSEDTGTKVGDLICDLLHLVHKENTDHPDPEDIEEVMESAKQSFIYESGGEL